MFNFLKGKFQRWQTKQAREELVYFIDMLKGADLGARATTMAFATDFRNNVMNSPEFQDARAKGASSWVLVKAYQESQKQNMLNLAAGITVNLHTERCESHIANKYIAKEMWILLAEAFPFVAESAENLFIFGLINNKLNIAGYDIIPEGFE